MSDYISQYEPGRERDPLDGCWTACDIHFRGAREDDCP